MRSPVSDHARRAHEARVRAMTPAERVELAHQLGEQALDLYCAAHGVDRATARRAMRRQRRTGRLASRVTESLPE